MKIRFNIGWIILPALAALTLAAGCGPDRGDGIDTERDFKAIVIKYGGASLHCVERKGGSHGTYSGLSCDWVRYHEEGS